MDKYGVGVSGEQMALEYLEAKNYQIISTNVFYPVGELDIVAKDGQTLVFVEVRTRQDNLFGHPLETLTKVKQQKIIKASRRYIMEYKIKASSFRYDVIAILNNNIEHITNAFYAKW
ncbi:MAG: YraN family protein [Clostridiales bacterium]|nr:YraN family protein [Clostridiales bacterium]